MVRAASATATVGYTYTVDGLRIAQDADGALTAFAWDWATGVPELLTDGDKLYLVGHDTLGWEDAAGWTTTVPDALGSVRQETDGAGDLMDAREWTPYGVEIGAAQAGLGYTGEWWDAAVGLQYLRARWYDAQTGAFLTRDAVEENHPYLYAEGNPVIFVDPSGWNAEEGRLIHTMIEQHYMVNYRGARDVRMEYPIAGASKQGLHRRTLPDGTLQLIGPGTGNPGYADLADRTLRQLYEIKPIQAEHLGAAELAWYLSFLEGWTPGMIYPVDPTYIGPWPSPQGSKSVYAQMRIPGVIVYWARNNPRPEPVPFPIPNPIPEKDRDKIREWLRAQGLRPVVQTCTVVVAVGATVVIIVDGIPGDEVLIPVIWAPIIP